jgi:MraZ protein
MDEKGRLKVPADYKHVVEEKYASGKFYVTSWDGTAAMLYPMEEWEKIERDVQKKSATDPHRKRFLMATSYYGQEAEMDAQGRLLLPQLLREKAGLSGDVAVLGMLEYLVVRNMDDVRKQVEENPFTDEDAAALNLGS